jgi:Ca-activated chloride channel family protein
VIDLRQPLALLLLLPGLWLVLKRPYRWGIPSAHPAARVSRWAAQLLPPLILTVLVLAACGPEWRSPVRGMAPVVDFAVVLDGSSSMRALDDGKQSRWDAARSLLSAFIAKRSDDRFALVVFSGHPVTLSPLTADHRRLQRMLDGLQIESRDDGTAIGSGLMTAVRRLSESPARSRVILLLTDGAENRGRVRAMEAAEEARHNNIRIHTVVLGGTKESLYPLEGGGFAKLHVENDPENMKRVAALGQGEAFAADDPGGLARSLAAIDKLEKTALPVDPPSEGRPLAAALLLLAGLLTLPFLLDLPRKRGRRLPAWLDPEPVLSVDAGPGKARP